MDPLRLQLNPQKEPHINKKWENPTPWIPSHNKNYFLFQFWFWSPWRIPRMFDMKQKTKEAAHDHRRGGEEEKNKSSSVRGKKLQDLICFLSVTVEKKNKKLKMLFVSLVLSFLSGPPPRLGARRRCTYKRIDTNVLHVRKRNAEKRHIPCKISHQWGKKQMSEKRSWGGWRATMMQKSGYRSNLAFSHTSANQPKWNDQTWCNKKIRYEFKCWSQRNAL